MLHIPGEAKEQLPLISDAPVFINGNNGLHGASSLNGHGDLVLEGMGVIPRQGKAVPGEFVKIVDALIHHELRRRPGVRTLESLPGKKGLPGRRNLVLSSRVDFTAPDCETVHSAMEIPRR